MPIAIRVRLSIMMFLQYFVWGAWYVTMGTYLNETVKFDGQQIGLAYGSTALAAMISPFFVGMIADRFFATEKLLAVLHLLGGLLLFYVATLTSFGIFYTVLIAYTLCYMPTLALTNSLSFHQMTDPGKQFPGVRVLGTIGWIIASFMIDWLDYDKSASMFILAAISSLALGVFCFTLPHTPPSKLGHAVTIRDILGLDALALMKNRSFAIFILGSFLVCIPLQFYYAFTNAYMSEIGVENATIKMSFGQVSEIAFMLVMPLFFVRLGVKKMLLIGMAAWMIRYVLFAYGVNGPIMWMLYIGILLHGICYDFFFVTGQIYVDREAPTHLRVGMFIGSYLSGLVVDLYRIEGAIPHDWFKIWLVPAAGAAAVLVLFAVFFQDRNRGSDAVAR
jgi:nucleoside transporter